ncbi:MAG: hypothetical protein J07AB43_04530 [Candidatus Nanosalina sp. J07AB43]|jgi:hypothetical protein|nr:MAG: hypothetical protein J07AB43_04530 [Candidatus Nanosalina sp. J07AB43]
MEIIEEIGRRRQDIRLEDTDRAYAEIRDLLTSRISQDEVREEKYFNDVDTGKIRSKVILEEGMDKFTSEVHEIFIDINKQEKKVNIQVKSKLKTEYPTEKDYQESLWYYAYRALFDKFLYGETRGGYEEDVEEKRDLIVERLRENLEEGYNG